MQFLCFYAHIEFKKIVYVYISFIFIAIVGIWTIAVKSLGKQFVELTTKETPVEETLIDQPD